MDIVNLLTELQSTNNAVRNAAEAHMAQFQRTQPDNLVLALLKIPEDSQLQIQYHQLAITLLRRVVVCSWGVAFVEFTGDLALSPTTKQIVREHLLNQLISTQSISLQTGIAYTLATIGKVEYPDEWPDLILRLLDILSGQHLDDFAKRGCLFVIKEFVDDGLSEIQFFQMGSGLLQALYNIVASRNSNSALALDTFVATIEFFHMVDDGAEKRALRPVVEGIVTSWCDLLRSLYAPLSEEWNWKLRTSATRAIHGLLTAFPKPMGPQLSSLFKAIWHDIQLLVQESRLVDINGDDQNNMRIVWLTESLNLLEQMMESPRVSRLFSDAPIALCDMLNMLVHIAAWPQPVYHILCSDVNQFVTTEAELAFGSSDLDDSVVNASAIRMACHGLLACLTELDANTVVSHMVVLVRSLTQNELEKLESGLFLLDKALVNYEANDANINIPQLIETIQTVLQESSSSLVRARIFLLMASLASSALVEVSPDIQAGGVGIILQGATNKSIENQNTAKVAILMAMGTLARSLPSSVMAQHQSMILGFMCQWVLTNHLDDDTPATLMDVLVPVMELDVIKALRSQAVISLIFDIITGNFSDVSLVCDIQQAFEELTRVAVESDSYDILCQQTLPHIIIVLQQSLNEKDTNTELEYTPELNVMLEILAVVLGQGQSKSTKALSIPIDPFTIIFHLLSQILLSTHDNEILQVGATALAAAVRTSSHLIDTIPAQTTTNSNGRELVLRIVEKLLSPDLDESAAMSAGVLVSEVVETFGNHLGDYLPKILQVTAYRITSAQEPVFIENLLNVFCRLTLSSPRDVVDFLDKPEVAALQSVLKVWLTNFAIFTKHDGIVNNIMALAKIYCLEDLRINSIIVNGDVIPRDNDLIITRSMAKSMPEKYSQISASLKIIKLFVQELDCEIIPSSVPGFASKTIHNEDDLEDDDDDYEDFDGDNSEGWEDFNATNHDSLKELLAFDDEEVKPRETDSETCNILIVFFKEIINGNIGNFKELYEHGLSAHEKDVLVRALG
ncbi:ARM repeat-containing protein [Nadsonia fulvescens var. elongata DSM 6958]|uniref:ARM repeat-containing protein n=1 Tax=Nadsonia fulvescens var. elongata DSM 6958 TaxID=857566 RepID=A0A1E3PIS2_9ASCO|nr:ARM repeat-containing protein [Nadsonia fulvescens var. elongata DSM 6958]